MRILYVEDDPQDAELARIELARAMPGAALEIVGSLAEARRRLERPEDLDVVVVDLNLPDGLGLDLVVSLRERDLPLAVVLLTGAGDERSAVAALKAGAEDYLAKRGDYLRRLPAVIESAVGAFRQDQARRSRPLRVLHVGPEGEEAEAVRRHLERHAAHVRVERVRSGAEVLKLLAEYPARHDVVMLDHRLADLGALDFLRALGASGRVAQPVVLVTGEGDEALAVEALRLGVSDYVVKRPGYLHELPGALEAAFHRAQLGRERAALRASEASRRLREEALEAMPLGVLLTDAERKILYANPEFGRLTGYKSAEVTGRSASFLIGPASSPDEVGGLDAALARGQGYSGEILNYRRDGTTFWNHVTITPVRDAAGKITNFIGVQADVTERRRTDEALRASEERLRAIAENIREVVWLSDPVRGALLYVSPAFETIWGRPCSEVLEQPEVWLAAVHFEDRARVESAFRFRAEGAFDETCRVVRPDGGVCWVRMRAYPVRDPSGRVARIVGTAEDVTEQRALEERLVQAQKMEAIGTLAGGIAHDFNNILAAINGYTELLQMELPEASPQVKSYLLALGQSGARAAALVRQILTFGRPGRHERRPLDLGEALEEPMALLRATLPATILFEVSLPRGLPRVLADTAQIHQTMMNLGANALHAMSGGSGLFGVRLEEVEFDREHLASASRLRPGSYLRLSVSDTGCGMGPETLDRIFEPFFTTKGPGEGTGLGLPVVHGIMRAHEGAIEVRSRPGEGTVFELYFPVCTTGAPHPIVAEDSGPPRGRGERIVLIDDEEGVVNVGGMMLRQLGYEVEAFRDPALVLERVGEGRGDIALVVSDVAMPGMSGPELAGILAKLSPGLPVLLMTGYDLGLRLEKIKTIGIREVLTKPFALRDIARAVRRVIDRAQGSQGTLTPGSGP
jgi:PAS domain S-box-containing protein